MKPVTFELRETPIKPPPKWESVLLAARDNPNKSVFIPANGERTNLIVHRLRMAVFNGNYRPENGWRAHIKVADGGIYFRLESDGSVKA